MRLHGIRKSLLFVVQKVFCVGTLRMTRPALLMIVGGGSLMMFGQSTAIEHFEVASVSQDKTCNAQFHISEPGAARFGLSEATMTYILGMAYGVGSDQFASLPSWAASTCYTIQAVAPREESPSNDSLRAMLRSLLSDRFKLTVHCSVTVVKGYSLLIDGGSSTLQPSKGGSPTGFVNENGLQLNNAALSSLTKLLRHAVGAHIIDKTGLQGNFDITLRFNPNASLEGQDSALPDVFTALREQLHLKLVPEKISLDTIVIDHLESVPTAD